MKYPMFSVFDNVSGRFSPPTVEINEQTAVRSLAQAVNTPNHPYGYSPKDYGFYHVADFEQETGKIIPCEPVDFIVACTSLLETEYEK